MTPDVGAPARRLTAVAGHGVVGVPLDRDLAGITRLAALVCGARSAVVSLVRAPDDGSPASPAGPAVGLDGPATAFDARTDPRFAGSAVAGSWGGADVGMYAAVPLRDADGMVLGTLSVFDPRPGRLDEPQRAALAELGEQVVQVLDLRHRESRLLDAVGELLRSNDDLGGFAGRMAHDLRAPLTAVLGFLALADGPFRGETPERVRECVGSALDAARRMSSLVDDLLAYATFAARPGSGPVAMPGLVRAVADDLADQVGRTGGVVTYAGPDEVVGDGTLLRQLLQNLVGNALTHTRPGVAPRVRVTATDPVGPGSRLWSVEVADNGPGVPVGDRERVFDPFVRLAGARPTGGSGIGLATCARIVDALGGSVSVSDAEDGGALFRVTLPRARRRE